eukprot:133125-Hanusia_phi.AAC.1
METQSLQVEADSLAVVLGHGSGGGEELVEFVSAGVGVVEMGVGVGCPFPGCAGGGTEDYKSVGGGVSYHSIWWVIKWFRAGRGGWHRATDGKGGEMCIEGFSGVPLPYPIDSTPPDNQQPLSGTLLLLHP